MRYLIIATDRDTGLTIYRQVEQGALYWNLGRGVATRYSRAKAEQALAFAETDDQAENPRIVAE